MPKIYNPILSLILTDFMQLPALFKEILHSDEFCWTMIIFSKIVLVDCTPSLCLSNSLPVYMNENQVSHIPGSSELRDKVYQLLAHGRWFSGFFHY